MQQSRRAVLTSVASVAGALAGCVTQPDRFDGATTDSETGAATPTATPTRGTPEYATCTPVLYTERRDPLPAPPAELATETVAEYVVDLEETLLTPSEEDMTGGWVDIGTPTVEAVTHGYLAYVPMHGGYINEDTGGETTQHADLGSHTASYFVNDQVVRLERAHDERIDPRETTNNVVLCLAEG